MKILIIPTDKSEYKLFHDKLYFSTGSNYTKTKITQPVDIVVFKEIENFDEVDNFDILYLPHSNTFSDKNNIKTIFESHFKLKVIGHSSDSFCNKSKYVVKIPHYEIVEYIENYNKISDLKSELGRKIQERYLKLIL